MACVPYLPFYCAELSSGPARTLTLQITSLCAGTLHMATTVGNWPLNKQYAQNEIAHRVVEVLQAEARAAESGSTWSDWRAKVVPTLGQSWETVDREAVREMGLGERLGVLDWGKLFFGQEVSTFLRACSLRLQ